MRFLRNVFPLGAAALVFLIPLGGCKSNTQQAGNQPAGTPGTQSPQSAEQPAGASGQAPAPGSSQGAPAAAPQASLPPPQPATVDLPAGTRLRVRLDGDLGSKISNPGDSFSATVADDVVVNGQTVIARGSRADGTVIDAKPLGHFKGGASSPFASIASTPSGAVIRLRPVPSIAPRRAKASVPLCLSAAEPAWARSLAGLPAEARVRPSAHSPAAARARQALPSPATARSSSPPKPCSPSASRIRCTSPSSGNQRAA